nr:unnamed protein product [Callosobruchus chinensis]
MNTSLEPSADASGICPNEVLPHLVDAGRKIQSSQKSRKKIVKIWALLIFPERHPPCKKEEGGQQHAPSASLLAGRLSGFYTAWSNIADNPTILSWVTGYEIPLVCVPYRREIPYNYSFPPKELQLMRKAIAELMDMGAVVHCAPVEGQYLSKIFLTDKANGTKRFILNLKQLNNYVQYFHLKWKTIEQPLS